MMKKQYVFWALLSCFYTINASAFCDTINARVNITMTPGNVQYITTRSRSDFLKESKQKVSPNTLGLTVANLSVKGQVKAEASTLGNQICVSIGTLDFKMGYETGDLKVYIDKKYAPGSCEYEVIKKHENYHVAVAQQAMQFFKPDVEKKIQDIIGKLRPKIVRKEKEIEPTAQAQYQQIIQELQPLLDHINKIIAEKNAKIDTPESYAQTTALCHHW